MKTGRKPKPAHLHVLNGTNRPDRQNQDEPEVGTDTIAPPSSLSDAALGIWREMVPELVRCHIMKNTDVLAMAALCEQIAVTREAIEKLHSTELLVRGSQGQPVPNPLFGIASDAFKNIYRGFTEFGMTPSSRTRIIAPKPEEGKPGLDID